MKINMMMVIVSFCFFTVLGLFVLEKYHAYKMAEQGLQQCVVAINSNTYEAVWSRDCPK